MARETKAERFAKVKERIDKTHRWRVDEGYDQMGRRMIDMYRGKTYCGDRGGYAGNVGYPGFCQSRVQHDQRHRSFSSSKPSEDHGYCEQGG